MTFTYFTVESWVTQVHDQPQQHLHSMLFFSISSFCECSCCPRSICHREHKLFSLGCSDSMIGVYKQAYQAGMTCTHLLPHTLLPPKTLEYVLPALLPCFSVSHFHSGREYLLHEVGYTSCCPGNPGPAHYPAPLRHSSLQIRTSNDASSLKSHRSTH